MSFVRTVLGDIKPEEMGLTFSHEHIIIEDSFITVSNKIFLLNDVNLISEELMEFTSLGGKTLVDTMPANCGRNVLKMAEVSNRANVNIIIPTGLHLEIYYPPNHWRYHLSEDELTDLFIKDITDGIDENDYGCPLVKRTPHKAGLIKLATGDEPFTQHQEKIFRAVVNTHTATGAPILTHTNKGLQAMEQAMLFDKLGADLNHVVLSHADKNKDLSYHKDLMQTGVSVEYDSHFRWKENEFNNTYFLLEKLLPEFPDQIVVGMDMAKNTYWKSYGGKPGLCYLLTVFPEKMKALQLEGFIKKIFYDTPQRVFSFIEK